MQTSDLTSTIQKHPKAARHFAGVVAADQLPFQTNRFNHELFYIVNNQPSGYSGQHWIVVRLPVKKADSEPSEFFDSFGYSPSYYHPNLRNVLILNGPNFIHNVKQIQDKQSEFCGYYCLLYILFRSMHYNMNHIIELFNYKDWKKNDKLAVELVTKFFHS